MEKFACVFREALKALLTDRMDRNEEFTAKFMDEERFRELVTDRALKRVYGRIRADADLGCMRGKTEREHPRTVLRAGHVEDDCRQG